MRFGPIHFYSNFWGSLVWGGQGTRNFVFYLFLSGLIVVRRLDVGGWGGSLGEVVSIRVSPSSSFNMSFLGDGGEWWRVGGGWNDLKRRSEVVLIFCGQRMWVIYYWGLSRWRVSWRILISQSGWFFLLCVCHIADETCVIHF